jgi:hypothetical protein
MIARLTNHPPDFEVMHNRWRRSGARGEVV